MPTQPDAKANDKRNNERSSIPCDSRCCRGVECMPQLDAFPPGKPTVVEPQFVPRPQVMHPTHIKYEQSAFELCHRARDIRPRKTDLERRRGTDEEGSDYHWSVPRNRESRHIKRKGIFSYRFLRQKRSPVTNRGREKCSLS